MIFIYTVCRIAYFYEYFIIYSCLVSFVACYPRLVLFLFLNRFSIGLLPPPCLILIYLQLVSKACAQYYVSIYLCFRNAFKIFKPNSVTQFRQFYRCHVIFSLSDDDY